MNYLKNPKLIFWFSLLLMVLGSILKINGIQFILLNILIVVGSIGIFYVILKIISKLIRN